MHPVLFFFSSQAALEVKIAAREARKAEEAAAAAAEAEKKAAEMEKAEEEGNGDKNAEIKEELKEEKGESQEEEEEDYDDDLPLEDSDDEGGLVKFIANNGDDEKVYVVTYRSVLLYLILSSYFIPFTHFHFYDNLGFCKTNGLEKRDVSLFLFKSEL